MAQKRARGRGFINRREVGLEQARRCQPAQGTCFLRTGVAGNRPFVQVTLRALGAAVEETRDLGE
jgi:hypothetical protein